jgi:WD40 repeat protein
MAVGLRNGNIIRCSTSGDSRRTVMESHSDGEVWGLGIAGDRVVTTADDNKIKVYDTVKHLCISTGKISGDVRRLKHGASSLSNLPASQCARACDINPVSGHIAIGCNDGFFRVRESINNIDSEIYSDRKAKEWIEAVQYSADGSKCAVGSHDNKIRIYDANNGYALAATCSDHKSFIVSVDWSIDGSQIRSVCGAHELLFFNASNGS